jgi:Transposase DDE domain group 1
MQASHDLSRVCISFDEPNLVSHAGLVAPAELAQRLGVADLVAERVHLVGTPGAPNVDIKVMTMIGGLLAGADSIDDMDVMRAGATSELFAVRAPSTLGTCLRSFSFGDVRSLDAVTRELLARTWAAGAGPSPGADVTIDLDSTICEVYGLAKQGAAFGYTNVRGYHPLLATCAGDSAGAGATQLLHSRLRGGNAHTARGAGTFVAETLSRLRFAMPVDAEGAQGTVTLRADSGFYSRAVVRAAQAAGARFSITVRANPSIRAAIAGIDAEAWTPIPYWSSDGVFGYADDGTPISGADVAEVPYTAFAGTDDAADVRLIVRRVRPTPGSQLALDIVFAYHAFITDRDGGLLEIEADHRRHAVIEQVIADLKGGAGLAHLPSAKFAANAAWLAICGIAYNLGRWCAALAGGQWARATTATVRRKLLAIPGRVVHSARRLRLRLPENWPWQQDLHDLRKAIAGIAPALT